jgi:hypothetical protein
MVITRYITIMKHLLKNGHHGVIAQLFSLYVQTFVSSAPMDLQIVINNHSNIFGDIPKDIPPSQDHYHVFHFQPRSLPPNIRPYKYLYAHKIHIEHMIHEMLEVDIIQPKKLSLSSLVLIIMKKHGSWNMCTNYRKFSKMTIKY